MIRAPLIAVLMFLAIGSSRADTLPLLGLPDDYTPGVPVTFDVRAPGLNGLYDYTLQFTVEAGASSTAPDLTITAAPPDGLSQYPFSDTSNFFVETDPIGGTNTFAITIYDSTSRNPVTTVAGVNDFLATVTIMPGVNLSGPITVQFTENDFDTSRDVGFNLPPPFVIPEASSTPPSSVPAPPAVVLLGIGGLCLAGRNRWLLFRKKHFIH